ncbi:MAG: SIS domain-containing protein [Anaerolineales bacterium]
MGDTIVFSKPSDDKVTDGHPPHYTELPTSLELQSELAPQFIQQYWPQALKTASHLADWEFKNLIFCGCGDSHHASYALSYAFSNWTKHQTQGLHAMEAARYAIPRSSGSNHLVVGISASGETARTIEAVQLARESGARTLGITTDSASTLAAEAESTFALELPEQPFGPGLISYLAALLAGYAIGVQKTDASLQEQIHSTISEMPEALSAWIEAQSRVGQEAAQRADPTQPILFVGSGPVRGTAMFAAAKVIEAAGQPASSQDVEEWAHLEYFIEPSQLPIWLLGAGGRTSGREHEIVRAAKQLGHNLILSEWSYGPDSLREDLSALALWAGPTAYANSLMARIGEQPFREFGGGRSQEEGGGVSRIRTSQQLGSLKDLSKFYPPN